MTFVFGHKNPDTDSVASAIAYSHLKNKLGDNTIPCVLGNINKETRYILDYFDIEEPRLLENVKAQIKDINYDKVQSLGPYDTILNAYKTMEEKKIRTLPIVNENNKLLGIVTMKDIAMHLIKGDFYILKTQITKIADSLDGEVLIGKDNEIEGKITVVAYYYDTIKNEKILNEESIVIVGDRYDIIEYCIECNVKLIIITGEKNIPEKFIKSAEEKNINIISIENDTYTISKLLSQCNYISSIMKKKDIIQFNENDYIEEVKEELKMNIHSKYPIINSKNEYLGFISRRYVLSPGGKKVILVDHNEYSQSVEGIKEAEIIEIVDHHKIGDISTSKPIIFRNIPVGSTCTIIYNAFKENMIDIDYKIAGLLISGILSDTMYFKSPTTTEMEKRAVEELNKILNIDIEKYTMDMFKAGTSLEGQSIKEIFYKDFKEFVVNGKNIGIGQVFTLDIDEVFKRKNEFLEYIDKVHERKDYFSTILLITDILKEGSYIVYRCENNGIITSAFNKKGEQGMFIDNLISRKKQVVPKILEAMNTL